MSSSPSRILVTGGAGFIGSALCRRLVRDRAPRVVAVDKLTYAGSLASLGEVAGEPNFRFEHLDIADGPEISRLLREERIEGVMHLAAETHVDRSIASPAEFVETNILGTFRLLETVLDYWRGLSGTARQAFRFHHVSTDEVFGDADHSRGDEQSIETRYRPSSPYSASKAASDHLVGAWHRTYGLPAVISNSTNTYGPFQFPDKLVPLIIANALEERPLPIYGTGSNVRDWLHVDDHARALLRAFTHGLAGHAYHFSGEAARTNLQVVEALCRLLDERRPRPGGMSHRDLIAFVPDRPGHDRRYAIAPGSAREELGWVPTESLDSGLAKTVDWYLDRQDWWRPLRECGEGERRSPG